MTSGGRLRNRLNGGNQQWYGIVRSDSGTVEQQTERRARLCGNPGIRQTSLYTAYLCRLEYDISHIPL